jgi:preprotein translocase subunit Sss1
MSITTTLAIIAGIALVGMLGYLIYDAITNDTEY